MRRIAVIAAIAALSLPPARIAAQPAGEAAYQEACASCHRTPARFMRRYLDLAPADRQAQLTRFLAGHHAEDAQKRAAIIAWLEANHARR
jgi:mono/diheme cytochrome c family protein